MQSIGRIEKMPRGVKLTLHSVESRAVSIPLKRPIVSRVGIFDHWPLILIDLTTNEGIVGRSYLEPYLKNAVNYIMPAMQDLAIARKGQPLEPFENFQRDRKTLNLIGYEGVSLIAASGLDMAAWDALAKAAEMPLAVFLGGSVGSVPAYNSNGLWLTAVDRLEDEVAELIAEGEFDALKLRLGRETLEEDLAAIRAVRKVAGEAVKIMVDFNQGLSLGDALNRCHALDDLGLYWFEEPIAYDNLEGYVRLTKELDTPVQLGENFYGPRALYAAVRAGAGDYVMPDLMRIGGVSGWLRAVPIAAAAGIQVSTHLYPEISAHLMRVTETAHWLEWQDWANPVIAQPFELHNGFLKLRDAPGNGLEWDEDAVMRYLVR